MDYDSSVLKEVLKQLNTSRSIDIIKSTSPALLAVSQHIEQHSKIIQSSILSQTGLKILNDVIPNVTVPPSCFATAEHLSAAIAASLKTSGFSDILESIPKLDPSVTSDEEIQSSDVLSNDDYVIIDEKPIKEWKIPDEAILRIEHNRLKMKTSDLINIIIFLLNFVLSIFINVEPSHQSPTEFEKKQYQIEIIQTQLLYDLLHNADVSSSSQADFLQSLIENVEVQKAELPDLEEYLDSIQQSIDNRNESENTESEN